MPIAEYFGPDYASARDRFRAAAARASAATLSYTLPDHLGPGGETLSLDIARLGAAEAQSALLVIEIGRAHV